MSRIGSSLQSVLIREISNNRTEMSDLSRQLSSGKVSETYGGLGSGRTMSLALRQEKEQVEGYRDTITIAQTRLKVMDASVGQLRQNSSDMRSQLLIAGFEPTASGQTLAQAQALARFTDAVDVLNTDVAGRYLFAGTKTDEAPVRPASELLDGAGAKAGFRQIMDERRQADMGADGKGRLALAGSAPAGVALLEDTAGSPFGFKLESIRSNLSGVTTAGPTGSPSGLIIDFAAPLPENGQELVISLNLPDGTTSELSLTANTTGSSKPGDFAVGPDAASTAANFQSVLATALASEAKGSLSAASMQAAANDFFVGGADIAQRVDGPPFDSATGLKDATVTDTVTWYTGDKSSASARQTSLARIGENTLVPYGARADEDAFSNAIKQFAIMSSAVFNDANEGEANRYFAMTERVGGNLGNSDQAKSIDRFVGDLAIAQNSLNEADKGFISSDNMITNFLSEIETADINEVATKLLAMQTQLQASYQVTGMLSKLSLANYL